MSNLCMQCGGNAFYKRYEVESQRVKSWDAAPTVEIPVGGKYIWGCTSCNNEMEGPPPKLEDIS